MQCDISQAQQIMEWSGAVLSVTVTAGISVIVIAAAYFIAKWVWTVTRGV